MEWILLVSSSLAAVSCALVCGTLVHAMIRPRGADGNSFERARRETVRSADPIYRWFEPLVGEIAALHRAFHAEQLAKIQWRLKFLPDSVPYLPEEFLAVKLIEGSLLGVAVLLLGFWVGIVPAVFLAALTTWGYQQLAVSSLGDKCQRRMRQFKSRLPFVMDMMALMMSAGASFQESLDAVVKENREHPLGQDLGVVRRELSMGRSRKDALRDLESRLNDEDIRELVFAVVKGEELGTPISRIFATQAEQLRLKRSQWAEKASGEAQVKMVYPGMLIMIACLLITAAPFLLKFVEFF